MRLITYNEDSESLEIAEFIGSSIPPYAILSHTWGKDEATYQDFISKTAHFKESYSKIEQAYALAAQHGCPYVWVDTCCIDKSSSAELTEAINSMFQWYARATICFAFLNDYNSGNSETFPLGEARWFSRGWTLQELIAPTEVWFYDQDWRFFGTRTSLSVDLVAITAIHESVLATSSTQTSRNIEGLLGGFTVAQRMSWAANRVTTREEDMAYSLMGIFSVNMPLLYGEGMRAFKRLQEEILKSYNDLTIFVWVARSETLDHTPYIGALASHPSEFERAGKYNPISATKYNPSFAMTNKGLRIDSMTRKVDGDNGEVAMSLDCQAPDSPTYVVGIYLKHIGGGVYVRTRPASLANISLPVHDLVKQKIFIAKQINTETITEVATFHPSEIRFDFKAITMDYQLSETHPNELWEPERQLFIQPQSYPVTGFHYFLPRATNVYLHAFVIAFGTRNEDPKSWWVSFGSQNALFNAALNKDMHQVRSLVRGGGYTELKTRNYRVIRFRITKGKLNEGRITRVTLVQEERDDRCVVL